MYMKIAVSLFLTFQILLSTLTFNVSMHFCLGELDDVGILNEAKVCILQSTFETKPGINAKSCCLNKHVLIDGADHQSTFKTKSVFISQFIGIINKSIDFSFFKEQKTKILTALFKPPNQNQNILVLIQTFLI